MKNETAYLIMESKKGNKECLAQIIQRFMPLIKKYANKVKSEDATQEIIENFIRMIFNMPGMNEVKTLKYIKVAVKNQYIKISKELERYENNFVLINLQEVELCDPNSEEMSMEMRRALMSIGNRNKELLIGRYVYGFSDNELGEKMGISRQAVCKARIKALKILKRELEGGEML